MDHSDPVAVDQDNRRSPVGWQNNVGTIHKLFFNNISHNNLDKRGMSPLE